MKAAVIQSPGVIAVKDIAKPEAGPGEVLLKVEACALCGTDQRVLKGEKHVDVPVVGHEIVCRAEALGEGVEKAEEGARYVVQTVIGCGECAMCKVQHENLCEKGFSAIGYQYNGGFAEYLIMPKAGVEQGCLIPVPEDMSAEVASLLEPLSCCINGMRPIPLEEQERVVIFGGGIIGVLNGLVAHARGAKSIAIMDVSQERLDLLAKLGLPFDHYVNSKENDPVEWAKTWSEGRGVDTVVVAASVAPLVPVGLKMLGHSGHLSIFAGMPKSAPTQEIDLNIIHYLEIHVHGANSSAYKDYIEAREMLVSGAIDGAPLATHVYSLDDFNEAVATQSDPAAGSLKVVIRP